MRVQPLSASLGAVARFRRRTLLRHTDPGDRGDRRSEVLVGCSGPGLPCSPGSSIRADGEEPARFGGTYLARLHRRPKPSSSTRKTQAQLRLGPVSRVWAGVGLDHPDSSFVRGHIALGSPMQSLPLPDNFPELLEARVRQPRHRRSQPRRCSSRPYDSPRSISRQRRSLVGCRRPGALRHRLVTGRCRRARASVEPAQVRQASDGSTDRRPTPRYRVRTGEGTGL